jgi:single-strand selective monofunctional uracil DNA glycosylase
MISRRTRSPRLDRTRRNPLTTVPTSRDLMTAAQRLSKSVEKLRFSEPVTHIYNPLNYAREAHELYLSRFGNSTKRVVFMGMNPGPWGMTQTGVPFGEIPAVRDWMKIQAPVSKPPVENPKRPIEGFACAKSEVSGRRLWGLMAERFNTPENFFEDHLVLNYCPLVFMEESGKNRTPDKLPRAEQQPLNEACDTHLRQVLDILKPKWCIGVGKYAETKLKSHAPAGSIVGTVLHPSPASPAANRGWAEAATKQLENLGVWK